MTIDLQYRYPLIGLLDPVMRDDWLAQGRAMEFATGETIFQEGTLGGWGYVIRTGQVRVLRRPESGRDVTVGVLGPGDLFGEYAILKPHRNTATCRAIGPVSAVKLPLAPVAEAFRGRRDIWKQLKRWFQLHGLLGYLRGGSFLGFMSASTSLEMLDLLVPMTFAPGQSIQTDGLAADCWFYIESGEVSHVDGVRVITLPAGCCFGERALIGEPIQTVSSAITETRCLCLGRWRFRPEAFTGQSYSVEGQSYSVADRVNRGQFPWIGQEGFSDCGLACLAMVAIAHDLPAPSPGPLDSVVPRAEGLSMLELLQIGGQLFRNARVVQVAYSQLTRVALPAIARLLSGHYVVVYRVQPISVHIGDPATSLTTWSHEAFRQAFAGQMLLLSERLAP